ncbi:hypothetical protein PVAND_006274 [Polypedilum vanderplanki]|uniref:Uncharacterized protein n=1 Tax=Polypedilum vanderplanki TaxID=319348 RepID=A0A9J6C2N3_POLVA|nr:hypothetical protein PVAND_006274 [Polypedilum vanderplanki]
MTPRRVKRRSVRGTSSRQSRRSDRGSSRGNSNPEGASSSGTQRSRSSTRSSRRKVHQNPVTKLMEQQQNSFPSFKHKNNNSNLTENNLKTLNNDYILNNQYHHQIPKKEMMPSKSTPALNSFQNQKQKNELTSAAMNRHTPTDPIYYNMNSSSPLLIQPAPAWNETSTPSPQAYAINHFHHHHPNDAAASLGHTNLTYVHSNPSLVDGEMNEYYHQTNRPPSVRSSYSNFHGARPLSYNQNPSGNSRDRENTKENLFANLSQQQQQQHSNRPQTLYQSSQPQAIPQAQVPMKRSAESRESLRFLNAAPPAYHQYNHHTPPDSETTM